MVDKEFGTPDTENERYRPYLDKADQHGDPSHDGPGEYEEMIR